MKLTAYDKKTKKYVDSLTTDNFQDIKDFKEDFKKLCNIVSEND